MRLTPPLLLALSCAAIVGLRAADNLNIAVINEVTAIGKNRPPVDPDLNPIHYQFITRGYTEFGRTRPGNEEPEADALLQHLAAVLRPLGYLPADEHHAPRVAFTVMWGSAFEEWRHAIEFLNTSPAGIKWEPMPSDSIQKNTELRRTWPKLRGKDARPILEIGYDNAYLFSIAACDWKNAFHGAEIPFWQVRALAPAPRISADDAFHRLIDAIAPYLGSEAEAPHLVVARAENAAAATRFGAKDPTQRPAPIDLTPVVALRFGSERFARK